MITFNGDVSELRGSKILGVSIIKSPNIGEWEALQIMYIPKRCRKPRILLVGASDMVVLINHYDKI